MKPTKNRRKVLKLIGSGAGTVALTGQTVAAGESNKKTESAGFKYDPRTQDIRSDISARLSRSDRAIAGKIDLGSYSLPVKKTTNRVANVKEMDNAGDFDERLSKFKFVKGGEYRSNGWNMKAEASSITNGGVTGLIRHSIDQPKEAFMLKPVTGKRTKSDTVSKMKAEFRGGE
jgi:hypothetical protein